DEFLRDYIGHNFGDIKLLRSDMHETADGRKLFVVHGDEFDGIMKYAKWLAYIGDRAYVLALRLNHYVNLIRRKIGLPYWSLSALLKHKVKQAVQIISDYEVYLAEAAERHHADGVVCGHIHHAEMKDINGTLYCNDGDWVESCTALVEHGDGRLEILYWADEMMQRQQDAKRQLKLFS
ncbi:MAG: UDP-2,3-diacylglucosamine hydrolase, partial [Rickettsiales bacterium]|nr:UDP-2,3-diacylglucosamine hydrolase [Rickettsiales bacterium]